MRRWLALRWRIILGIAKGILSAPFHGAAEAAKATSGGLFSLLFQAQMNLISLGIGLVVGILYAVIFLPRYGQTPGKMLFGLRITTADGSNPGAGQAILREVIGKFISAICLFLGYLYFSIPRVILTIMAAVAKLDPRLEEAARSLGAGPWAVHRDVILPALVPAFVASGAIAFATAMGAFGTAFTLATNVDVLAMLIYTEFTLAADLAMAAALSVGLGLVAWAILVCYVVTTIAEAPAAPSRSQAFLSGINEEVR